jgi:uncharacterized cupredoxin-like copper-binding protein
MTVQPGRLTRLIPIVAALALTACSTTASPSATAGGGGGGASAGAGTTVNVTLTEFKVELDKTQVPAGNVTFQVKNGGTIVHEFVVFKTDDAASALPKASEEDEVNEDDPSLESMGEVEDVAAGSTKSFSADLEPGSYVAICNVEGHYMAGMHVAFTVQ